MRITPRLIDMLKQNYGTKSGAVTQIIFTPGNDFSWDHTKSVITYNPDDPHGAEYLLHEASHAFLGHENYGTDIELIKMERDAWEKARVLGVDTGIKIDNSTIEASLDTYRDWLHARSLCPACDATGYQSAQNSYQCPSCHQKWRVNEARSCGLKRYITK